MKSDKLTRAVKPDSILAGPPVNPKFEQALDELIAVARQGHDPSSEYYNPSDEWITSRFRIFQKLPAAEQKRLLADAAEIAKQTEKLNAEGKAGVKVFPDAVIKLDSGGHAFFSQLGVARRPDLTQYLIQGFAKNRDGLAFSAANQELFAEVIPYITKYAKAKFAAGDTIVQVDQRVGDVEDRSFHARLLLFGTHYLHPAYVWRMLTFPMSAADKRGTPDILEVSLPTWRQDLNLPKDLMDRLAKAGIDQLVFKAPTKGGLSLHLGFDYLGEHKMGPLSVAMFLEKEKGGLAVQAALSVGRITNVKGEITNAAMITTGPSLHGKSTLTIMIEPNKSDLADRLGIKRDASEGVYPMNDDIVLLQPLAKPIETNQNGKKVHITHGIDGTENNLYAVPFGLTREDDPITYDTLRGEPGKPNASETLENTIVDSKTGVPDFSRNPVRNMRMVLPRKRLLARKGVERVLESVTKGRLKEAVHVPMEAVDRILWQGVMRQNTVVPPLRKLSLAEYIRVLMMGEAVNMGAAAGGVIGRPYVEYFSDPFIIGLEDDNANLLFDILSDLAKSGIEQEYYMFNTGGLGADTADEAKGALYKKISREVTLGLQEAVLRQAVRFEREPISGSEVAVAIANKKGEVVMDLRKEWLPSSIYPAADYKRRVEELGHQRYYGRNQQDKAGILRYTKVRDEIMDLNDIPAPTSDRELAWLLSFYWHLDQAYATTAEAATHKSEGKDPSAATAKALQAKADAGKKAGLKVDAKAKDLGIS